MASRSFITACLFATVLPSLFTTFFVTATQPCYYPNGDISTEDVPCRTNGGASICCPLNWQCMSDGLCYLANEGYYERHTCTDNSWPNASCPRICTHDMSAAGNEAMLWCATGQWCCDGNRSWNCCNTSGTSFFDLPPPRPFAFVSVTPSVSSSLASTTTVSSGSAASTPVATSPSTTTSSLATQTTVIVTTGNNGATKTVTTVVINSDQPAVATSSSASKQANHHQSNTAIIVGLAIGIPLICTLGALTIFLFFRHYRSPTKEGEQPTWPPSPPAQANYQPIMPGTHAPELAGYPVAETKSGRESELYGSEAYLSPTLSTGTNTVASLASPPLYGAENAEQEKMAHIPEEPQELWGGYVPYRPPQRSEVRDPEQDEAVVSPVEEVFAK